MVFVVKNKRKKSEKKEKNMKKTKGKMTKRLEKCIHIKNLKYREIRIEFKNTKLEFAKKKQNKKI